ncbi:unannotated protein [freshwater metagenome]|uniref:Unannotated protein n=1 Tax=freshwater metagenome TaxID=449393 RepID=A0A6J7CFE9_9ZZZZ|nr:hypothetical protein [Actinomycetota bacterium]
MPDGTSDGLDDLIGSLGAGRRRASRLDEPSTDSTAETEAERSDALDDLIRAAGAQARSAPEVDTGEPKRRWARALSLSFAGIAVSGAITEAVGASQVVSHSGTAALAVVWPLAALGLLGIALLQAKYIDRVARLPMLVGLCLGYAAAYGVALVLLVSHAPTTVTFGLAWLLADQMNYLLPLMIWALAADVFTAGQGVTVFPSISRWLFVGQVSGLGIATIAPSILGSSDSSLGWLLVLPPVVCVGVAIFLPRRLRDATASAGHGRSETTRESLKETVSFIGALPAFRWMLIMSLAVVSAGAIVEFGFLDIARQHFTTAGSFQTLYAGTALIGIVLCWAVQTFATTKLLQRRGVEKVLQLLPLFALVGAALLAVAGAANQIVLAVAATLVWRLPRWSADASARQTALATIPDERRARSSLLIDLVPVALGFIVVAIPIGLSRLMGNTWIAPLVAVLLAVAAVAAGRRVGSTWDDTQLSYRLKRRKRLG